ncbi:hypothetical protein ACWT_2487 [Actinoplanes sp. SE50]|uniref:hypothetical protein n=1 Tax=unclassified Actinoplanes TaxID=2626549 RepID=UPI00023ED5DD|nr:MULTISPECIES: hypothetical protein [unclassified Actinoplanes]AEV83954.1 hypothetical protein ACPL_3059 [Actinoplanes sp. SE50/110]ATO81902.1 hypothetical protein ACWT_2487 [Actinoplanes sp. SE50]SLL99310.1 hypothetical protein ACSP50_2541 [Actinoplanes sp. SE50/110]
MRITTDDEIEVTRPWFTHTVKFPEMSEFELHRTEEQASLDGQRVPGLRAEFFRRADGDRVASVGRYSLGGRELLLAWGYVDEEHCRHNAVRAKSGSWFPAEAGCPDVRLIKDGQAVIGLAVRASTGEWMREECG